MSIKRKLGKWFFDNGYLIVIVAAAPLVYIWRGKDGFWVFIPIAVLIIVIQVVMALAQSKKEQTAKMKRWKEEGLVDTPIAMPADTRHFPRTQGPSDSRQLYLFSRPEVFFKDDDPEYDYASVIELSKILTNNNARAVSDITLLVRDGEKFESEHRAWCEDMYGMEHGEAFRILDGFAYWLTGYDAVEDKAQNPPAAFGAYIDWKEGIEDIIWNLEKADKNLGYALELEKLPSTGEEFGEEALRKISGYLMDKGFLLLSLDTYSDCYHLFVIPLEEYGRLEQLAEAAGYRFVRLPD